MNNKRFEFWEGNKYTKYDVNELEDKVTVHKTEVDGSGWTFKMWLLYALITLGFYFICSKLFWFFIGL